MRTLARAPYLALIVVLASCEAQVPTEPPIDPGPLEVTGVSVTATSDEVAIGGAVQLTATVAPFGVNPAVTWSSDDPTRLTVDANGLATAAVLPLNSGVVTVTATSVENTVFSGTVELTIVCGLLVQSDVADGTTLPSGTCWTAQSALAVNDGTLTVEPDVEVSFGPSGSLSINGDARLSAIGTALMPITFTSTDPASHWRGIRFDDSRSADNRLEYVTVENGGSDQWSGATYSASGLLLEGNSLVNISMSEIIGSAAQGFTAYGEAEFSITGTTFDGNAVAAWLHPNNVEGMGTDNAFVANDDNVVRISYGNNDRVETAQSWANIGVPYELQERLFIDADLTIDPGVTIHARSDVSVIVRNAGSLNATGTVQESITFVGSEDVRGWWQGIQFQTQSVNNVFEYVEMGNGGSDQWTGAVDSRAMIYLAEDSKLLIRNSTLYSSDHYALWVPAEGEITGLDDVIVTDNARAMILHPNRVGEIDGVLVSNNDDNAIRITFGNNDRVETSQLWQNHGTFYRVMDRTFVRAALTIEPGTTIEFEQGAHLIVDDGGSLNAVGDALNRITFRGREALSGYWKGLEFGTVSASNRLEYVDLMHAGSDGWFGGSNSTGTINVDGNGGLVVANATISLTGGYAGIVRNGGSLACTNVDDGGFQYYVYSGSGNGAQATCPG
ncbi:MAG: Ig-like domain-containing protein [Gemmatimonadota bacterium]